MSEPVVLASASPRRRQLLECVGLSVRVSPSHVDESRPLGVPPIEHALALAHRKAFVVPPGPEPVVAADTVVHRGELMFDKPTSREEAEQHLRALSGGWHEVTTAVCVRRPAGERVFSVTTRVRFRALSERDIAWYVATGEADDKAGAYGIQGLGGSLVAELAGSYTNVIGLPLEETLEALR
jgi:septum formation protein